ncbi:MAG: hypothetical protein LC799_32805, partial [Actinobacteria bacterium]|nr:hypothetical protein [Actinomycetota bacterium]
MTQQYPVGWLAVMEKADVLTGAGRHGIHSQPNGDPVVAPCHVPVPFDVGAGAGTRRAPRAGVGKLDGVVPGRRAGDDGDPSAGLHPHRAIVPVGRRVDDPAVGPHGPDRQIVEPERDQVPAGQRRRRRAAG